MKKRLLHAILWEKMQTTISPDPTEGLGSDSCCCCLLFPGWHNSYSASSHPWTSRISSGSHEQPRPPWAVLHRHTNCMLSLSQLNFSRLPPGLIAPNVHVGGQFWVQRGKWWEHSYMCALAARAILTLTVDSSTLDGGLVLAALWIQTQQWC